VSTTAEEPVALLSVRDLTIRLGEPPQTVVDKVSFAIPEGRILGLAGESGSGKSITASACIAQFPHTTATRINGSIELQGRSGNLLTAAKASLLQVRRHEIRTISQEPSTAFNPVLTIGAQLKESLRLAGHKGSLTEAAFEALAAVGIQPSADLLKAYPDMFSGGMLQRLAIACALTARPRLLIADEPTTALDTSTQKRIIELLTELNQTHRMAILFISHDLRLLKGFTQELMIMQAGVIVERGSTAEVLENPRHAYTRKLIEALPGHRATR
jgi:ABC-type dipeptide/oligopeptide/nickel transport system ATPase component